MMKFSPFGALLCLCLSFPGVYGSGQARPTATGPGFRLPTIGGNLQYSLSASEAVSNGYYGIGGVAPSTNISGNAAFLTQSQTQPFSLVYSGGHFFGSSQQPSQTFQSLSFSQALLLKRWSVVVADGLSYLPATATTGLSGVPGVGDINVDPVQVGPATGLGILTNYGPRVTNTITGSVSRSLTGSLSLQGSGNYSILKYLGDTGSGNAVNGIDTNSKGGSGGLNYRIDARNTVGGSYSFSQSSFGGNGFSFATQSVSGSYSRRWTRRLSTNVAGGPQRVSSSSSVLSKPSINLTANVGLSYTAKALTSSLSYVRGTGTGSGVIQGAVSDSLQYGVNRSFGRTWNVAGSVGYARTKSLPNLNTAPFSSEGVTASGQASRAISRHLSAFAAYTFQNQALPYAGTTANAFNGRYQVASFGITYSPRPIHLGAR